MRSGKVKSFEPSEEQQSPGACPVPEPLRATVLRIWKEDGGAWLARLPTLIETFVETWSLQQLTPLSNLSVSYVAQAISPEHGPVVLKIGFPHAEMTMSLEALQQYQGNHCCRLLACNREQVAMLLTRIRPGTTLREVTDWRLRMEAAAGLVRDLPVPLHNRCFPEFARLLANSLRTARTLGGTADIPSVCLELAERLHADIHDGSRGRMLLHGDLHHDNILLSSEGWVAIDPQGWAGEKVLEVGRFFQHEWPLHPPDTVWDAMDDMMLIFSGVLGEPIPIIAASCYLNHVRTACWAIGVPDRQPILAQTLERMDTLKNRYGL
jgi:streptomycin 6-kinase